MSVSNEQEEAIVTKFLEHLCDLGQSLPQFSHLCNRIIEPTSGAVMKIKENDGWHGGCLSAIVRELFLPGECISSPVFHKSESKSRPCIGTHLI